MSRRKKPILAGAPMWMVTFADLMAILVTFFVLLLSFSEIDAIKIKAVSDEMTRTFRGNVVGVSQDSAVIGQSTAVSPVTRFIELPISRSSETSMTLDTLSNDLEIQSVLVELSRLTDTLGVSNDVEVVREGSAITAHLGSKQAFLSGSAVIRPEFMPVLDRMARILATTNGRVRVTGHTDDIPIASDRYRSNWALSADRAVAVAHVLMERGGIGRQRLAVEGHADNRPRMPNVSDENRALNRRVDIEIDVGSSRSKGEIR